MTKPSVALRVCIIIFSTIIAIFTPISSLRAEGLQSVFENPETKWTSPDKFASPRFIDDEIGTGYEFNCDFSLADLKYPRCYWDTAFAPIDLSTAASIVMKLRLQNVLSIHYVALYFESDGIWYLSKKFDKLAEGINTVIFHIEDYRADGKPNDIPSLNVFKTVNKLRFNVFNRGEEASTVTVTNLSVSVTKVETTTLVTPFQIPEKDRGLKRTECRDAKGRLLETRMILDEQACFLIEGADAVLDKIKRAGFNAYMPCIWHGRGSIYKSKTTLIEPQFASFFTTCDATAEMIAKAHARGIEVHPWFCVAYRGKPDPHPEFTGDSVPKGAYDLQDPSFRDFIAKEIISFATVYDVDGINLDYIRTNGISYSNIAKELYRKKYDADINELKGPMSSVVEARFLEWQEAAVSDIVQRVSEGIRAVKPDVIISTCGHPRAKPFLHNEGRNEWIWLEKKWIDIAYSMDYGFLPNFNQFEKAAKASASPKNFVLMLGNYEDVSRGKIVPRDGEHLAHLIDYALKKYPDNGIALYWYGSLDEEQIKYLRALPFKEDAVPFWQLR